MTMLASTLDFMACSSSTALIWAPVQVMATAAPRRASLIATTSLRAKTMSCTGRTGSAIMISTRPSRERK
jgi:hypothetical protein